MKFKHVLFIFGFVLLPLVTNATVQVSDELLWEGQSYPLYDYPLEEYFYQANDKPEIFDTGVYSTICLRGYSASFEMVV